MRRTAVVLLPAFALIASGCFGDRDKADVKVAFGNEAARAPVMGPGDVSITSRDGALVMAVVGDTVRMQLSDSLRKSVAQEIDTAANAKSGIGASITRSVGKVVSGAMGFVVRVPVKDVENLRYENGRLRFDVRGGKVNVSGSDHSGKNAEFSEADARRFIDAVERRKKGVSTAM